MLYPEVFVQLEACRWQLSELPWQLFDPEQLTEEQALTIKMNALTEWSSLPAMEMFLRDDGVVLVNELAPRVHNSGHYTIEACVCSQFENHVRAVMGWPLGSSAMRAPAAAMVNLLGNADGPGRPHGVADCLAVPGAHLHLYGKALSKPGRKMGHITALGATVPEALERARQAARTGVNGLVFISLFCYK